MRLFLVALSLVAMFIVSYLIWGDYFEQLLVGDKAADYIGIGIATLVNLLNPEVVFVGGGVAQAGEQFWTAMRDSAARRMLARHEPVVEILPATHGSKAAVTGAVCLILNEVMSLRNHA